MILLITLFASCKWQNTRDLNRSGTNSVRLAPSQPSSSQPQKYRQFFSVLSLRIDKLCRHSSRDTRLLFEAQYRRGGKDIMHRIFDHV